MTPVQAKLLASAKMAGLGLCLIAAPVAFHAGQTHKPKIVRIAHRQAPNLAHFSREFTCPQYRSQHPVTFSKWDMGNTPVNFTTTELTPKPSPVDEPAGLALWFGGLIVIGYSWYRGRV